MRASVIGTLKLSDSVIERALLPFEVTVGAELCESIRIYMSILLQWNSKIALTTVTDPHEILRIHFGESFFAAKVAGIVKGRVADIGTGAGFPGIPIRMVSTDICLSLIEPITKKTALLGEVLRRMGILGVSIIRCRMEELSTTVTEFDFITARALGSYEKVVKWSAERLCEDGKIVLLLGPNEINALLPIKSWNWHKPVVVPGSHSRFVLVGQTTRR